MRVFVFAALLFALAGLGACAKRAAEPLAPAPQAAQIEEEESDQFLDGHDWADVHQPTRFVECPGSHEFIRGCRSAIEAHRKAQEEEGERWAQVNTPRKASECHGAVHVELGCRRYFLAHLVVPKPPGQGKYEGMTTAECVVEVNANFELAEKLFMESGNPHGAAVSRTKQWLPELEDCENYDKIARFKRHDEGA